MLGVIGRRSVEASISLFAVLGFCYVPLGQHTGLEHVKAVFATKAAQRAAHELAQACTNLQAKLLGELQDFAQSGLEQSDPSQAAGGTSQSGRSTRSREPRAHVPRLGERTGM